MALTFEQLKAAFGSRGNKQSTENEGFWSKFYPFYKMDFDAVASFRFLPDLDEDNPFGFVVENKYHELTIAGKKKKLACLDMYGESCPCCEMSAKFYNEENDTAMGKVFWRKIDHIAQGLVMSSPFEYPIKDGENPVRLISLGPKLFGKLEKTIANGDFEYPPYDLVQGCDFKITKTKQGEYADYSNSEFARKSTAIPEELLSRIELNDLKKFRYAKMERAAMEANIEAFMTGKSIDDKVEKAEPNVDQPKASQELKMASTPVSQPAAETPAAQESAPAAEAGQSRADAILARLRNKGAAKA